MAAVGRAGAQVTDRGRWGGVLVRSVPGPYSVRLHRIIAVIAALAALTTDILSIPVILARLAVGPVAPGFLRLAPLVTLPIAAGLLVMAAAILSRRRASADEGRTTSDVRLGPVDRFWHILLAVLLLWYPLLLAVVPFPAQGLSAAAPALAPDQDFVVSYSTPVVVASPLVLPRRTRFAYAVALAPLSVLFLVRTGSGPNPEMLQAPVFLLAFNLLFLAAATWVLDQARRLDVAHQVREAQEATTRIASARNRARRRMNDFVHDHVLSALVPLANGLEDDARLRSAAGLAVSSLEGTVAGDEVATSTALFGTIVRRSRMVCPEVRITVTVGVDHVLPADVGRAVLDAVGEALTNSLRHAGGKDPCLRVGRSLAMVSDEAGITVVVADDGRGFDPHEIPTGRHGIRHSIIRRMEEAGGRARVEPGTGRGTRVELIWHCPREGSGGALVDTSTGETAAGSSAEAGHPVAPRAGSAPRRGATGSRRAGAIRRKEELPWGVSVSSSMQTLPARVVGAYALLAHVFLLAANTQVYTHLVPVVVALVAQGAVGVLLLWEWPGAKLPRWVAVAAPLIIGATNMTVLLAIPTPGWPGYAAWTLGSATMLCWGLIMRERRYAAWAGWVLLVVTTVVWVLATGRPLMLAVSMTVGHMATIALWDLVATWSGSVAETIAADERRQIELVAEQRAQEEVRRLQDDAMASVADRALPVLDAVASGTELTPVLRTRARLLEAELRDEIRAPCFTGTRVVPAARAARGRGVDVVLLDDGPESPVEEALEGVLVAEVARVLEVAEDGRVVVRRLPPGRRVAATLVTRGTHLTFSADGDILRD